MAIHSIAQGTTPVTYTYSGTPGDDTYIVPMTKTNAQSFLFGTYTIDTLGSGNDTLVFKATDVFSGATSLFFPQLELSASNSPVWTAYDQRANPLRIEWNSFNQGDTGKLEVWHTQTGATTPVLAATIDHTGTYIGNGGLAANYGNKTGAIYFQETITEQPGFTGYISDTDRLNLGGFYVKDGSMLSSMPVSGVFDGTSVNSLASGDFDKFIFNTISGKSSLFGPANQDLQALEAEIQIDAGANFGDRKYLNLAGSLGAPAASPATPPVATPVNSYVPYTSLVPDVEYKVSIDLALSAGITIKETDTGVRNWWDDVNYSDLGITADGKSGLVNTGHPTSPVGVVLTTGNFTGTGNSTATASSYSLNSVVNNAITVAAGHGFAVGDTLIYNDNSATMAGPLYNGNRYSVTEVLSGNQIKLSYLNSAGPEALLSFAPGYTFNSGASFKKLGDYDVTVLRQTAGVTDVFSGFESFQLTSGADTINYTGGDVSVSSGKGDDVWNIGVNENFGWNELRVTNDSALFSNGTNGLFVNLSGQTKSWNGVDLASNANTGKMRDTFGTTDTFNFSSGASYSDDVRLKFEATNFSDRFYLAADGMGRVSEYRIEGSGGYDQFHLSTAVMPSSLAMPSYITTNNLNGLLSGQGSAFLEEGSRFFESSNYKVSFSAEGTGSAQKLVATLYDVAQISLVNASGEISVSDTSGWSVGDTVIYRAGTGAEGVTGLTDGMRYTVASVTTTTMATPSNVASPTNGTVKLSVMGGSPASPIALDADAQTAGSSLEHIVSTNGVVDGVNNSGTVSGGYVTFADDVGQFSRMAIRVDGKITDQTNLSFYAQSNVEKFVAGEDFYGGDLASSQQRAAFSIDYQDLYDDQSSAVARTGILYVNGIVDKRGLGFDRLVDYAESAYVGARSYSMTAYNDILVQTVGSTAVELTLSAAAGRDKIFVEGVSSDVNQRIEINLGDYQWGSRDGEYDQVEIGVSKLAQKYGSVQYIDVTNADSSDLIKFVEAEGYTLVKNTDSAMPMATSKNYATYSIYEGDYASNSPTLPPQQALVMQVRVTEDRYFSDSNAGYNSSAYYSSWGQITSEGKTITANPSAIAMTANADAALLYEDTSTTPYLMGEGNDYVVTMGGDQDIGLGGGNDFLSIRNYGQQLFVSGGAGVDQLGMGGSFSLLSDGTYVSDQWSFGSIDVAKAKEFMAEKYPTLAAATDPFAWDSSPLDRVMVATNRFDGTKVYFQAEELGFSNGTVNSGNFLPPISETYDTTARSLTYTTLYGRSTNDTVNLKVADVDMALKYIGSWLNSTTLAPITTGNVLVGSHALEISAQAAATPWFTGNSAITNAGFKLVDIENIRLFDNAGKEVTVRVAGSSSYESVDQAMQYANRGDVIFVAETKEGALTGTTRAAVNMDTTVSVSGGLRVAFEEGANRTVNTAAQLVVNMTGSVKTSVTDSSFFGYNSNALEVLGTANVNINGSAISDLIVGNKGNNVISSFAGNDVVFGGNGSDMLIGGVGNDVLVGGSSHRITATQHTPDDGVFNGFNLSTDAFRINNAADFEFQTGDKVIYKAAGGTGISVANTALTETSSLYVIRGGINADGSVDVKFSNSVANAKLGVALDITSNGTATTHGVTLDNVAYAAANLAGSDYLYGGSGNDHLIASGVTGSLTVAGVRDNLTMNGGSGNDTFTLFGNSGKISLFGGSGSDNLEVFNNFLDVVGVNKAARMVDFAAAQDDVLSTFSQTDLGATSVEARLNSGGVTLSQLVSPPLPVVNGSGENGNYEEIDNEAVATYQVEIADYQLSIADLINLHQAHAA